MKVREGGRVINAAAHEQLDTARTDILAKSRLTLVPNTGNEVTTDPVLELSSAARVRGTKAVNSGDPLKLAAALEKAAHLC